MDDALANKRAVEAAMKRKPPKGRAQGQANPQPGEPQQPGKDGQPSPQAGQGDAAIAATPRNQPIAAEQPPPADEPASKGGQPQQAKPADAQSQHDADAAQRERMQRALQQAKGKAEPDSRKAKPQAARNRRAARTPPRQRSLAQARAGRSGRPAARQVPDRIRTPPTGRQGE